MSLSGIWTSKGINKLAAQTAGGPTLTIDKIALGDGGGIVPAVVPSQAALLKEVWRGLVNAVLIEPDTPNAVTVEAVIPYSIGGFYIREWGIYDTDGDLIAVGPHAEFYKPLLAEGSGAELLERIQLPLTNAGQVNLTISSEALATRKYVDQTATAKAREEVTQHDGNVTAHGGRIDELVKRKINTTAPLAGGGDLSATRTLTVSAATLTATGVVQLNNTINSTSATEAATANAAKLAYDRGSAGVTAAATAQTAANAAQTNITAHQALASSVSIVGHVKLNNTVTSTSATEAATANAAKLAYDRGTAGVTAAATAQTAANAAQTAAGAAQTTANAAALKTITINTTAPLAGGGNLSAARTLTVSAASITAAGVVQLNNTINSTSVVQAATANAAKLAYDRGTAGVTAANVANSAVNILGTLFIGSPIYLSTTTLPTNCMWADGSLALLADWPQFAAKYKAGGFAGMVLAANSTQAIKDANLGKFVLNANSTGLYMPRYGGQFMRGWTPGQKVDVGRQAGSWQANEFKTHLHAGGGNPNVVYCDSTSSSTVMHAGTSTTGSTGGIETRPTNNAQPIVIYMGVHA